MGSVTISANSYAVYGDSAGFDRYWTGGMGESASAWLAASATLRLQSLVAATRMLDRQDWQGAAVGTPVVDSVLQWPRSGVTDKDGNAVSSGTVPDLIVNGAYELAGALLVDSALQTSSLSGSNVKSVYAKGVAVEFFSSTLGITGRLPTQVQDLVGQFLSGSGGTANSVSYGTDDDDLSQFDNDDTYVIDR